MKTITNNILILGCTFLLLNFICLEQYSTQSISRLPVIFDTDANNELDDQHALAYLLMNGNTFNVKGITVNATFNGGDIDEHYKEAGRVLRLCNLGGKIPLLKGANGNFDEIKANIRETVFDGYKAVNFIIENAQTSQEKLTIIAVGKLTNVALALEKEPAISEKIKIVWLGSNYPDPGEYNQDNDTSSLNYLLKTNVPFDMVTVRYGKPSGTDAVKITQKEVNKNMPGKGPKISKPVIGRHGGSFNNFGDYSVSLFKYIDYYGDPPSRALFDMAAVAILKNPQWAEYSMISSPVLINNKWMEQPDNKRRIGIWENFDKEMIINDFYNTLDNYTLVSDD